MANLGDSLANTGYTSREAAALIRLALKWRAHKYKVMLIGKDKFTLAPHSLRIYLYNARRYIRERPSIYPDELQDIVNLMGLKVLDTGLLVHLPLRYQLGALDTASVELGAAKGADYQGRKLYVHWISQLHGQGEYLDIPGEFTVDDLAWFKEQAEEYKDLLHIEFGANVVRVIWDAQSNPSEADESPW